LRRYEAIINQHIFKVIPYQFPKWFVYYQLRRAMPSFQAIASHKATTMGHIQRHHLSEVEFAVPPKSVLDRASSVVGPIYASLHANEQQSFTLAKTCDTLLPKLLSGQLRAPEGEGFIL